MTNIWETCKITNKTFKFMRGFLNHLRKLGITSKEYYDTYHKKQNEGICYCGKETTYDSFSYRKYCSSKCSSQSSEHRVIVKNRFKNNPEALISFIEKRKSKIINPNVEKRRDTIKKKAANMGISEFEYYSRHSKKSYLSMSKDAVESRVLKAMKTKENTKNFGGRSGYKKYDFFDEVVSLQGYEYPVLKCLIEDFGFTKSDIMIGKSTIPIVKYDKNKLYFPDFYLPSKNLLIEVKSKYTLEQHLNTVIKKCRASVEQGYSILLLVIDKHEARNCKLDGSKKLLYWAISSQSSNPTWYGEGSTTILKGVDPSGSKSSQTINGL